MGAAIFELLGDRSGPKARLFALGAGLDGAAVRERFEAIAGRTET